MNETIEVFQMEENALEYNEVAPSTQHEEDNHEFLASNPSKLYDYFDPERPVFQQQGDIGILLQLPAVTFEDSVEIVADKMCDEEYRKQVRSLEASMNFSHISCMWLQPKINTKLVACMEGLEPESPKS